METECASCEVRTGLQVLLQVASISQLTVSRLSRKCGILNISRPPRTVTGNSFPLRFLYFLGIPLRTINLPLLDTDSYTPERYSNPDQAAHYHVLSACF
jgi:hypothetical protein